MKAVVPLCIAPLLLSGCGRAARSASEVAGPAAREAGEPLARGGGEVGERQATRAAVEAEAEAIVAPYGRRVVDTACRLKDSYDLLTAEDFEERAAAVAGLANVGQVRSLIEDLKEAKSSGERVRVFAVAFACQSAQPVE
ncbi:hypothetical protein [Paractinoplanes brasiliensis]|nr:hypothetical protein [Actinoplanes brasiliensis]GID32480.1 hypothetical protein Abr02nite_74630 [Actinoplanes brasiliensis]